MHLYFPSNAFVFTPFSISADIVLCLNYTKLVLDMVPY